MTTMLVLFAGTCLAADTPPAVTTFFTTYCLRCHDAQKQEGRFRLDTLPREFVDQATAERWEEVVFRMNSGEMPPQGEEKTIPPTIGAPQYGSKYNHAVLLEDDFSFYSRRGQEWKVVSIAAAENTLRTYWKDHDCMSGGIVDITLIENPPLGSSGISIRWQAGALLDGFRPGRIVRLNKDGWPKVRNPPQERLR